jgi:type IV secretory pathway VirB3-like protein
MIFSVLVLCTQVNMMSVMLLWVYIHTAQASIPTVAMHIFQACAMWIYTQSNITDIIFTWVHNTNTEKIKLKFSQNSMQPLQ